jgi:hypothetical protein
MNKSNPIQLPHTRRLLRIHRYLSALVSAVIAVGASASAIRIGNAPVLGPIVAVAIAVLFFVLLYGINRYVERGLLRGDILAWSNAVFWSLAMSVFIVGIPALRELFSPDVRHHFFKKG